MERRRSQRVRAQQGEGSWLCNRFVEGYPYAARVVDASADAIRVQGIREPELGTPPDRYALEVMLPGNSEPTWLWTRVLKRDERGDVLAILGLDPLERTRIARSFAALAA